MKMKATFPTWLPLIVGGIFLASGAERSATWLGVK